jgi:biopolymer transport protein ExbD
LRLAFARRRANAKRKRGKEDHAMSRKRKPPESSKGVQMGLIITPMLDMSFQILAFFIMTYHPSALEGHIPGLLAPPEKPATKGEKNVPDPEILPSIPEDDLLKDLDGAVTVYVKAMVKDQEPKWRLEGTASHYFIKTNVDANPVLLADVTECDKEGIDRKKWDEVIIRRLETKLKELGGKDTKANLKIAGDGGLKQQYIMSAYDAGKKAGFAKIHFVPPPVLNTKIKN